MKLCTAPSSRLETAPKPGLGMLYRILLAAGTLGMLAGCASSLPSDPFAGFPAVPSTTWTVPSGLAESVEIPDRDIVRVTPDDDVHGILAAHPAGTTYSFASGLYRELEIVPKRGDVLIGEERAILSGARLLAGFAPTDGYWSIGGLDQEGERRGECSGSGVTCSYPEDLYVDDQLVQQVERMKDLRAGTWFFDYDTDTVYLADDPAGHRVELATVPYAFSGTAASVVIRGFVVEKYANPAQRGAIGGEGTAKKWTIVGNEIRFNHGAGVKAGAQARVLANFIHDNGQLGLAGSGEGILVEGNELAHNNVGGFSPYWGGGGAKFVLTTNLEVIGNYSHHNIGPGLWTDIDNMNTRYESNLVVSNYHAGIKHEISYDAVIVNNIVEGNGYGNPNNVAGAGIFISSSPNVEVVGNRVSGNFHGIAGLARDRGDGAYGPHQLKSLDVHDNEVEMTDGYTGIMSLDRTQDAAYSDWGNRFEGNHYTVVGGGKHFWWLGKPRTFGDWTGYGLDTLGTLAER